MLGGTQSMDTGDAAFVPAGMAFEYWSDVAYTKFFVGASGTDLSDALVGESEKWDYAAFPSYLG